jgi:K+-sensing histidine kinase KdpD
MKLLLWLLGGGVTALIVALVLAGISISGVQSLAAAMVFLWIAFGIFAFCLLVAGVRTTANLSGNQAALATLLLVGLFVGALWARSQLAGWLTSKKAAQAAAQQIPPPSA